jgi:hypothetical protein
MTKEITNKNANELRKLKREDEPLKLYGNYKHACIAYIEQITYRLLYIITFALNAEPLPPQKDV